MLGDWIAPPMKGVVSSFAFHEPSLTTLDDTYSGSGSCAQTQLRSYRPVGTLESASVAKVGLHYGLKVRWIRFDSGSFIELTVITSPRMDALEAGSGLHRHEQPPLYRYERRR